MKHSPKHTLVIDRFHERKRRGAMFELMAACFFAGMAVELAVLILTGVVR